MTDHPPAPFKPSLAFLRKVRAGQVKATVVYSKRSGAKFGFVGGEETANKHRNAGLIIIPPPSYGRPGIAYLTEKGQVALNWTLDAP